MKVDTLLMAASVLFITLALLLTGCSGLSERTEQAGDTIADGNDTGMATAERLYCDGQTRGAIYRRYGGTPLWDSYFDHCNMVNGSGSDVSVPANPVR